MAVRIVTDSTCDLPPDLAAAHGITVVPLSVIFGNEEYLDGLELDAGAFYQKLRDFSGTPRTSQPSVSRFRDAYSALAEESPEIVSIHISSRLSGTLNSATIAKDDVDRDVRIELLDSSSVSLGLGGIVLEAAIAAQQGGTMADVAAVARRTMDRTRVVALVDTLEYLRRGGRIGRASSFVGSLLSIKPVLHVENGEVSPLERVRTRGKALERLFEIASADRRLKRVLVGCGGNDEEAQAFIDRLQPLMPHTEFHLGRVGPAVGVHAGPNVLGVALIGKE